MSDIGFHSGGLTPPGQSLQVNGFELLSPGEKIIPLQALMSHWSGDSSKLVAWAVESGLSWPLKEA